MRKKRNTRNSGGVLIILGVQGNESILCECLGEPPGYVSLCKCCASREQQQASKELGGWNVAQWVQFLEAQV